MTKSRISDTCGCCTGVSVDTPRKVYNRPGLSAISYRIGRHRDFKKSLLARLTLNHKKTLQRLTSRSDDDFTIALIDAFSTVADVLAFYQERIANESYLQTSGELPSGQELAYLIGYRPRPGVAASTYLAFTLEDRTVLPSKEAERGMKTAENDLPTITIAAGTKVQSVPEQDEDPQFFESIENIEAKAEWNAMPIKTSSPQTEIMNSRSLFIEGTEFNLEAGDLVLLLETDKNKFKKIEKIEILADNKISKLWIQAANTNQPKPGAAITETVILNKTAPPTFNTQYNIVLNNLIQSKIASASHKTALLGKKVTEKEVSLAFNSHKTPQLGSRVYVFREQANIFGYNAAPKNTTIVDGEVTQVPWSFNIDDKNQKHIYLDRIYEEVVAGDHGYIGLKIGNNDINLFKIKSVDSVSISRYGISAKAIRIGLHRKSGVKSLENLRQSIVFLKSDPLPLSEQPIDNLLQSDTFVLDLAKYYHDLKPGRNIIISGELSDLPGVVRSEAHLLETVSKNPGNTYTTVSLKKSLVNNYIRDTVRINANVALASHGETVQEVLGSGHANAVFQKFKLKQNSLTFVSSDAPTGITSSLEIRVNDILWQEVESFYNHSWDETIYTLRQNSQGESIVTFGDGITGSRLSTGNQNIRATYRKGIGSEGMLKGNQLNQLISRPLNLKAVNNPIAPSGAQDPETIRDIKKNANLTIFTLGRIVSLRDFEDYSRAFAGISKAKATWVWEDNTKTVHITIAGENGSIVPPDSLLYSNLKDSIENNLSQKTAFAIENYLPKFFIFTGSLLVDPNYEFEKVHDEVVKTIREKYSFHNREFGQPVALSELIGIVHTINGVVAVDFDTLSEISVDSVQPQSTEEPNKLLVAALATKGSEKAIPAELLLISDDPIILRKMS